MKFHKRESEKQLHFNNISVGQKFKGRIKSFSITPSGFQGSFITDLGITKAMLGSKKELNIQKCLNFKGKECWLTFQGTFQINGHTYPNFNIEWI